MNATAPSTPIASSSRDSGVTRGELPSAPPSDAISAVTMGATVTDGMYPTRAVPAAQMPSATACA